MKRRLHRSAGELLLALLGFTSPCLAQPHASAASASPAATLAPPPDAPRYEREVAGLLADIRRIVSAEESLGWVTDSIELEDMQPALLKSVCRARPPVRVLAQQRLQADAARFGDPEVLFEQTGSELTSKVEDALSAKRRLQAIQSVIAQGPRVCPFWIEVEHDFQGLQTDRNRFTINAESGGVAILRKTEGLWTIGGGGFARVLPAYGFDGVWTLLLGPEFGGGALLRPGDETTSVAPTYFAATPIIARIRDQAWHYDIELSPVGLFETTNTSVSYGGRIATTVGFSALFTQGIIPWAGASIAYEHHIESGGRPVAHFIRGGFRAGLSWDP